MRGVHGCRILARTRCAVAALAVLALPAPAYAGDTIASSPQRDDTVATRPRPEVEPVGVPAGGFRLYPRIGYALEHDDNIFAVEHDKESDVITTLSPGLVLASEWARHAVKFAAQADRGRYRDQPSEDYDDWQLATSARMDLSGRSEMTLGAAHMKLHEPRESPDAAGGLNPTQFKSTVASFDLTIRRGALSISPSAMLNRLDYENAQGVQLGEPVVIRQDDRDRNERVLGLQASYDVGGPGRAFVRARSIVRDYDDVQAFTGRDRSSDGFELGIGATLDLGGITRTALFVGRREQRYSAPLLDIRAPVFEASVIWKPTELTTVEFETNRTFGETTAIFYSGYLSTSARLGVDHELLRNVLLNGELLRVVDEYEGLGAAHRRDETLGLRFGFTWLAHRNLALSIHHEFTERSSDDNTIPAGLPDGDFERQSSWLRLELRR